MIVPNKKEASLIQDLLTLATQYRKIPGNKDIRISFKGNIEARIFPRVLILFTDPVNHRAIRTIYKFYVDEWYIAVHVGCHVHRIHDRYVGSLNAVQLHRLVTEACLQLGGK